MEGSTEAGMRISSSALIQQSRGLIDASRRLVGQARRRVLRVIRGGSTALAEPAARRPARRTTPQNDPPRIWAGPADGRTRCSVCGKDIPGGSPEYEVVAGGETLLLDRACFVAWHNAHRS
jgi:hypothetical protein